MASNTGILLTNIGSPDHPTPKAVRHYLAKFLSDPRVIELPNIIWKPILHGYILRFRPRKSAALYQKIWTPQGSPLQVYSEQLTAKLQAQLKLPVALGMHYGNPTIKTALEKLRAQHVKKIIVLPLFPQYSDTTTAVTFDQVMTELKTWRHIPEISTTHDYASDLDYINALSHSARKFPIQHLLFSFHGIPERNIKLGDPYQEQCQATADLLAGKLQLTKDQWTLAFQSRVGRAKWLMPYTDKTLRQLPQRGITDLHVICPGFAVDCLETLEEIALRGKEQFFAAGGKSFHYIPALNASDEHLLVLQKIIKRQIYT